MNIKHTIKKEQGITLIALIITIIVLLILAGISIATLLGDNGIISKATKATDESKKAEVKERVELEVFASYDKDGFDMGNFKERIKENLGIEPDDIADLDDGVVTFPFNGYIVKVTEDDDKNIKVEVEGNGNPEELPTPPDLQKSDTKILYDKTKWTNQPVEVTIETSVDKGSSILQYSIDKGLTWNIYKGPFKVTENNTEIRARLWNGVKEGGYATGSVTIIDRLIPSRVEITEVEKTTSSIKITAEAEDDKGTDVDGCSGIVKYRFSKDGGINWFENEDLKQNYYTFEGLSQSEEYTFKVEATDDADNVAESKERKETPKSMPGGTTGIGFSQTYPTHEGTTYTEGPVEVTITAKDTSQTYSIEYRIGGDPNSNEGWNKYPPEGKETVEVSENGTLYARLKDSALQIGEYALLTIENIDKTPPTNLVITPTNVASNTIMVDVSATDGESGIDNYTLEIKKKSDEDTTYAQKTIGTSKEFTGLVSNVDYTVRATAKDKVGNTTVITKDIKTINVAPTINSVSVTAKTPSSLTISAKATDTEGENLTYKLYIDGAFATQLTEQKSGNEVTLNATELKNYTEYSYYIEVYDAVNNKAQSETKKERTQCNGQTMDCTAGSSTTVTLWDCSKCDKDGQASVHYHCPTHPAVSSTSQISCTTSVSSTCGYWRRTRDTTCRYSG